MAFGASRREAGGAIVKAGGRAALERLVALVGGPGLLLLPALAAGLVLSGLPPMQVVICHPSASLQSAQACKSCTLVSNTHAHGQSVHSSLDDAEFVLSKFYVPTWNALLHKINAGETDKAFLAASSGGARVHPVLVDDEHACEPDLFAPCRRRRTRWC